MLSRDSRVTIRTKQCQRTETRKPGLRQRTGLMDTKYLTMQAGYFFLLVLAGLREPSEPPYDNASVFRSAL